MKKYALPIVIEKDKDGYFASCPSVQGCYTQGKTYKEVIANIRDAIRLHIEDILAHRSTLAAELKASLQEYKKKGGIDHKTMGKRVILKTTKFISRNIQISPEEFQKWL